MPLHIVRQDITKMKVDAIVNSADPSLCGSGGADGALHRAAGEGLAEECASLGGCCVGEAKITDGYNLPCNYVIHTVGPVWQGGNRGEAELLASCYRNVLVLALEKGCESVAFPLISSGAYGFPKERALKIAVDTIGEVLLQQEISVWLVVFDRNSYRISAKLFSDIAEYIDDHYADAHAEYSRVMPRQMVREDALAESRIPYPCASGVTGSLDRALMNLDESFSQMLLRKIDERGMTDAQCYKKANVDRKLFSKIRKDKHYRPSKPTAIAFAVALELSLPETEELLKKAGYALSHSSKFDVIIEYFIKNGNYNIFEINEALFAFDQSLLGV